MTLFALLISLTTAHAGLGFGDDQPANQGEVKETIDQVKDVYGGLNDPAGTAGGKVRDAASEWAGQNVPGAQGYCIARCMESSWNLGCHAKCGGDIGPLGGGWFDPVSSESIGDPHLVTFNGTAYDSIRSGEFRYTAMCEDAERFEVQARQKVGQVDGFQGNYMVGTAIAVGTNTIEVTVHQVDPTINGEPARLQDGEVRVLREQDGSPTGSLSRSGNTISVVTEQVQVVSIEQHDRFLNAKVTVAYPHACDMSGMWGDPDGLWNAADQLVNESAQLADMVEGFRMTDEQSLFTDIREDSPALVTIAPSQDILSATEALCEAAGVDADALADCALDVAVLGTDAISSHGSRLPRVTLP